MPFLKHRVLSRGAQGAGQAAGRGAGLRPSPALRPGDSRGLLCLGFLACPASGGCERAQQCSPAGTVLVTVTFPVPSAGTSLYSAAVRVPQAPWELFPGRPPAPVTVGR